MFNDMANNDCIAAESTDLPGTLGEDAPRSAENSETREDCSPGTLVYTPSSDEKATMRWVRGGWLK
jgi:hypothetical protein